MGTKAAFVSTMNYFPWGGSEELWSRAALRLAQDGVEVHANVWRWRPRAKQIDQLMQAGCKVSERRTIRRLTPLIGDVADRWACRWLDQVRPDLAILCLSYHTEGLLWMQACRQYNVPYALLVQSAGEVWWPADDDALALATGYEGALACYFVSQANLEFVRTQLATPIPLGKVVRNPFNVSYDAAPPWPAETDVLKLACIGRLQPMAKGQDILLEVLRAEKWRQRAVRLTLYGAGPNEQTLRRFVDLHGMTHVEFGGYSNDIAEVWSRHHALVLPSRYEGLPLVVVEAMLCARPCVVTDVSGNAELIVDNATGFVAAGVSPRLLDEALERLWQRRAELCRMGQTAAREVRRQVPRDPVRAFADELLQLRALCAL